MKNSIKYKNKILKNKSELFYFLKTIAKVFNMIKDKFIFSWENRTF